MDFRRKLYLEKKAFNKLVNKYSDVFTYWSLCKLYFFKLFSVEYVFVKAKKYNRYFLIRSNDEVDLGTIVAAFKHCFHVPPIDFKQSNARGVILDLGANIGITVYDFAIRFPGCKVIGVEMDKDNYYMASRNTKNMDNVILLHNAIWIENGIVSYKNDVRADGYTILEEDDDKKSCKVESITIDSLLEKYQIDRVSYLKMDIEGAERSLLFQGNLGWLDKTDCINIELHDFSEEEKLHLKHILKEKGFIVRESENHWASFIGIKAS